MEGFKCFLIYEMCILTLICSGIAQRSPYKEDIYNRRSNKKKKNDKPNIIVIITDDQDELLGMHFIFFIFK